MRFQIDLIFAICTVAVVCFQLCLPYFMSQSDQALHHHRHLDLQHRGDHVDPPSKRQQYDGQETAAAAASMIRGTETADTNALIKEEIGFGVYARPFASWPTDLPLPCLKPTDEHVTKRPITPATAHNGFLFMKLMKTGGSTAAGMNIRIMREAAKHSAVVGATHQYCQGRFEHCWGHEMLEGRGLASSFAWTVIRDPTKRAVSQFYHFQVSREGTEPSDFYFRRYLASETRVLKHYYLQVLSTKAVTPPEITRDTAPQIINRIFNDYNLIGITERMDETAVCLMMLLNIKMGTILYLNAKASGGFDDGGSNKCAFIQPSRITRGMESYFSGATWQAMVQWDELLYKAANRSLDLTIDRLGRPQFERNLARFQDARAVAEETCIPRQVFPCTADGRRNPKKDCLWKDSACGNSCLDQVAQQLGLWD